jgi:hypothetical protein
LRIKENFHDGHKSYSSDLQERVIEVFQYATRFSEIKRLIRTINKEAVNLRTIFVSEEDRKIREDAVHFLDGRMQATVYYTLKNIDSYKQYGWKQLVEEESDNE